MTNDFSARPDRGAPKTGYLADQGDDRHARPKVMHLDTLSETLGTNRVPPIPITVRASSR